jgi:uncharacterized membrane protein YhiD involved in acid resistance
MEQRIGWELALASLSLAVALSMAVAWVYTVTHEGLSYLRSFVQSLALGGLISATVMLAIGDDVARGLGVVGALTIVRFRTTLKDTRDLMFVFASLASGVACGVQSYAIAVLGAGMFVAATLYLSWSGFGSRRQYDAVLRLRMPFSPTQERALPEVLERHCRRFVLVNMREAGANMHEHAYQVQLTNPAAKAMLLRDLGTLPGLSGAMLLLQDSSVEV